MENAQICITIVITVLIAAFYLIKKYWKERGVPLKYQGYEHRTALFPLVKATLRQNEGQRSILWCLRIPAARHFSHGQRSH